MSLAKIAQLSEYTELDKDLLYVTDEDLSVSESDKEKDKVLVVVTEEPECEQTEISFLLPLVPGGESQEELEDENELSVEEEDQVEVEAPNKWDWKAVGLNKFLPWLKERMDNPPPHTGLDSVGIERCIAHFEKLNRDISQAVRSDVDGILNIKSIERAREQIHSAVDRLNERLERINSNKFKKKKKKADETLEGFTKEAQKAAGVNGGVTVVVPLLISHIARVIINGIVSAGKNQDDLFDKLSKKYSLTIREKAELIQLLQDMNFPVQREVNLDDDFNPSSEDNPDFLAQYFA